MIPSVLHGKKFSRAYKPRSAVLRLRELPSQRDVMLIHVRCLDREKDYAIAWQTRVEVRAEADNTHRIFVYGKYSPPRGEFAKLEKVVAQKLDLTLTTAPYFLTRLHCGTLCVQKQECETGRLKNFLFSIVRHVEQRKGFTARVEFVQVNNTKLEIGEYAKIMAFLEKETGCVPVERFLQQQLDL